MEWLVNMTILLEPPNYSHDHDDTFTYQEVFNMVQRANDDYTVKIMNHYNGERPDQVIYAPHMIIDIRITFIDSQCYHNMFINSLVSVILCHCQRALISIPMKQPTTQIPLEPSVILWINVLIIQIH
jgi:hypothetical protein